MRINFGLSLGALLVGMALASAQYPYQGGQGYGGYPTTPYGGYAGGPYGGVPYGGSPLSPYLNLANRGITGSGLPAVNYYNFVRPNLPNANRMGFTTPGGTGWGAKPSYFPTLQSLDEESLPGQQRTGKKDENGLEHVRLPPTGHGAGFTNTLGYFGPMMGGPGGVAGSAGHGAAATLQRPR